jgi:FkbM family methyltransferase
LTSQYVSLLARSNPINLARIALARVFARDATVCSDGIKLVIGTHQGEGAVCALQGRKYEEIERFLAVAKRLPQGLFFDLGANIGTYAVRVAAENPHLHVVAIEALPWNRDRVRCSAILNGCLVDVPDFGISDTAGSATIPLQSVGRASVRAPAPTGSITIDTTTLDALADRYAPGKLRLLKIDLDGMCMKALTGGLETISRCETIIYFENDCGVAQYLRNLGYKVGSMESGTLSQTDIGWALWAVPPSMIGAVS